MGRHLAVCRPGGGHHHNPTIAGTLISDFQPPDCEKVNLCFLSLPSLWHLVMAAQADKTFSLRVLLPTRVPQSPRVSSKLPAHPRMKSTSCAGQKAAEWTGELQPACCPAFVTDSVTTSSHSPAQPIQNPRPQHLYAASPRNPSHLISFQKDRRLPQTIPGDSFRTFSGSPTTQGLSLTPKG